MDSDSLSKVLSAAIQADNLRIATKMGLIVGALLNCINQGECLIHWEPENLQVGKLIVTYTVPFFVSLYTSTLLKLKKNKQV